MRARCFKGALLSALIIVPLVVLASLLSPIGSAFTKIVKIGMSTSSPNQPPRADFNFSPERPMVGEKVYFFDNSEDLDGYIVEWYWYYSLHSGDNYWTLPIPFGNGEQNPTLTFDHAGEAQINLRVTDDDGAIGRVSCTIQILDSDVEVLISPTYQGGVPGATLAYTVTVKNTGDIMDNYTLTVGDNSGWGPTLSENLLENVPPGEDRVVTLNITIPSVEVCTLDNIVVTATSLVDNAIRDSDGCFAHRSKALFYICFSNSVENIKKDFYAANPDIDTYVEEGSRLILRFYTYADTYEGENVFWEGPGVHVEKFESIPHPLGMGVEKASLALESYWENRTIASFIMRRSHLWIIIMKIKGIWPYCRVPQRNEAFSLILDIKAQWPFAPS